MYELFRRIHYLLNRRRLAQELDEEMEFHREMSVRNGEAADQRRFGNTLRLREESRDAWGWTWIDRAMQDVRYSLRGMRRTPGFTLSAVLMLAVGIGVNVAAFGFFNIVMLRPLPVRDPETLVRLHRVAPNQYSSDVPYPAMQFYREHSRTLSAVLALDVGQLMSEQTEKPVKAFFVTNNFFRELGAQPALGRLLPDEARRESDDVIAVLGFDYWQTQFGGDLSVAGRTIRLNGKQVLVIGVVSRDFSGFTFSLPDVWMPITQQPSVVTGSALLTSFSAEADGVDMWGRLGPGVTAQAAAAELRTLTGELRRQRPDDFWQDETLLVEPGGYAQNAGGRERGTAPAATLQSKMIPIFRLIGALTLLILLVTCGNLGSLLLARGLARQREMSIRTAVGAGRGRLIRQLLTESLMLSSVGACASVLLGYGVLRQMMRWTGAPVWLDLSPDWRVIAFTIAAACAAAMLFGLTPALQLVRSYRGVTTARHFLVGTQVSASCVLLIVAGLLVRAIERAISHNPGFEYKQVISIDPRLAIHGFSAVAARGYLDRLQERLRSVPGVESVSLAVSPPLGNRRTTIGGEKDGRQFAIYLNRIDPEFFATMKIPLLRGRNLRPGETNAVVVSDSLARILWRGGEALGEQFSVGAEKYPVVGVVANARANALADGDAVEVYQTAGERDLPAAAVLVRVAGPAENWQQAVAGTARRIDARVVPAIQTLSSAFARKIENTRQSAAAVSVLGSVALLLACTGIVGVVAYAVSQREKEIGIRMALGSGRSHLLRVIVRQFWAPIAAGLVAGAAAAAGLTQFLRGELYGVSPLDPLAYAAATTLLALTAAAAVLVPARRALRVDPMRALRSE